MRVLVLGGTGWVGHHIALAFHRAGHEVTICSRGAKSTYIEEIPKEIPWRKADKNDESQIAPLLQEGYDVIVDSVPTEAAIDHVVKHARGLKHYIHCSSTGGYAPLLFVPGDETMPYRPFMGGWKVKVVVDSKVMELWSRSGFPATVIRPCYITGPGLLPLDNLGGRRKDFISDILNGVPLDLPNDGQALLQPVHVEDLAHSFLLAAEEPRSIGQIYNICLEKAVTITRYLQINAAALGREVKINLVPLEEMVRKYQSKTSEVGLRFFATHMCFDIRKAREQLGYRPRHTTEQAIEDTARWASRLLSQGGNA